VADPLTAGFVRVKPSHHSACQRSLQRRVQQ